MSSETPLSAVSGIPATVLKRLHERWIESAEQLVALGATPDGADALAQELKIETAEVERLIASARAALHPDVADELARPVDTGKFPLGAMRPRRGRGRTEG
jgi:hypothetical protein